MRLDTDLQEESEGPISSGIGAGAGHVPTPPLRDARWVSRLVGNQHVQRLLERARGYGKPLDVATRQVLEPIFRRTLDRVRVHTEPDAVSAVLDVGAKGITHGHDIHFGPTGYDPGSSAGRQLIAHEVAHVVQQTAPPGPAVSAQTAEEEAQRAAQLAAVGQPLDFELSSAETAPAFYPGTWSDDVNAAQKLTGPAQATAMLTLVKRALSASSISVNMAGSTSPAGIDPADYLAAPVINFDPHLNSKQSWPAVAGGSTRKLSANYGYSFSHGGKAYAIIGPKAIDAQTEIFTQMAVGHELAHALRFSASKAAGSARVPGADEELQTWTQDFVTYFHRLHHYGPQWLSLINYYEDATATARGAACSALVGYYNAPPVPAADVPAIKAAFERWLRRRLSDQGGKQLIQDLSSKLGIALRSQKP
jgi:hypothetical protein